MQERVATKGRGAKRVAAHDLGIAQHPLIVLQVALEAPGVAQMDGQPSPVERLRSVRTQMRRPDECRLGAIGAVSQLGDAKVVVCFPIVRILVARQ